jgi:hypothetical protein
VGGLCGRVFVHVIGTLGVKVLSGRTTVNWVADSAKSSGETNETEHRLGSDSFLRNIYSISVIQVTVMTAHDGI